MNIRTRMCISSTASVEVTYPVGSSTVSAVVG